MEIITFEGIDKSGKYTQSKLLEEYLKSLGYKVVRSEFHRYDTPTGKLIQQWLYKEWDVDKITIELIMSADKHAQQGWFKQLEQAGVDYLILDRYIASQHCFAEATGIDKDWVLALQKHLIKPDYEFFIDISPETSMKRKGKHGENDRYESDRNLLQAVRNTYHKYFQGKKHKFILKEVDDLSVEEIANIIKTITQEEILA